MTLKPLRKDLRNNSDVSGKNGVSGEYIRVAVKTPEENARLISALKSLEWLPKTIPISRGCPRLILDS